LTEVLVGVGNLFFYFLILFYFCVNIFSLFFFFLLC